MGDRSFFARHRFASVLVAVGLAVGGLPFLPSARAVPQAASSMGSSAQFELDGDLVDSPTGDALYDWDTLEGEGAAVEQFLDPAPDAGVVSDDVFGGGSKEPSPGPTWSFVDSNTPNKTDLLEGGVAHREIDETDWLYLYFRRASRTGDAFASFEFNKTPDTFDNDGNPATPEIPKRTAGDLLISLFIINGGQDRRVELRTWSPTDPAQPHISGTWDLLPDNGGRGVNWDIAVNADNRGRFDLAEAVINLNAFGINPACPGLGFGWIKTTSSASYETAQLQDRTTRQRVNLSNCATKHWVFTFDPAPPAGLDVYAVYTVAAGTDEAAVRTLQLVDDGMGTFRATDEGVPEGAVSYRFEVRDGATVVWQSATGSETFAAGETKTNTGQLAYVIDLTPDSQENLVGTEHTFTATVTDTATGDPLPAFPVGFAVTSDTPLGCGVLSVTSGTTDANGAVQSVLTGVDTVTGEPTPCDATVTAWVEGAGGTDGTFDAGEADDPATKSFVSYDVDVSPGDAVNEASPDGSDHTFTVTVTKLAATGVTPVVGASVALSLADNTAQAQFVEVDGTAVDPPTAEPQTCTTDENGQCTVTIRSTQTGSVDLVATYQASDDEGRQQTFDEQGGKAFVDYRIDVTPASAENEVGVPHEFIIVLEKKTNETDGFQRLGGEEISLSLSAPNDAVVTSVNGADPSEPLTCTTRSADDPSTELDETGTCSVIAVANQPGTATLSASFDTSIDTGTGTATIERDDTATKLWSDFRLRTTPATAVNVVDHPHTMTVTLQKDTGGGWVGLPNEVVDLALDAGDTDAVVVSVNGADPSDPLQCTTREDDDQTTEDEAGTCEIVINASTNGVATLTASWSGTVDGATVTRTADPATKTYVALGSGLGACPTEVVPGGVVEITPTVTVDGGTLTNLTVVLTLPPEIDVTEAGAMAGEAPTVSSDETTITWSIPSAPEGAYTAAVHAVVDEATDLDVALKPSLSVSSDQGGIDDTEVTITVTDSIESGAASADARATGLQGTLLGTSLGEPTPDSDAANPDSVVGPRGEMIDLALLYVEEDVDDTSTTGRSASALAHTAGVVLTLPNLTVTADTVVARSASAASGTSAHSSLAGSLVQNLVVNGTEHGDVTESQTITVRDPLTNALVAEVHVLEPFGAEGAAAGVRQPDSEMFTSGLAVNGLRVSVPAAGPVPASEIVISTASSSAAYPSGLGCGVVRPAVAGEALAVGTGVAGVDSALALSTLGSTGGTDGRSLDLVADGLVTTGTAATWVWGEVVDGDDDGETPESAASSRIEALDLADGLVTASVIESSVASVEGNATGDSFIADLVVSGVDVCVALGLEDAACRPAPDTELVLPGLTLILNDHTVEEGGIRIVAVRIIFTDPLSPMANDEIRIGEAYAASFTS